jgi:hypothetical protein
VSNAAVVGSKLQCPTLDLAESVPGKRGIQGERSVHVLEVEMVKYDRELQQQVVDICA